MSTRIDTRALSSRSDTRRPPQKTRRGRSLPGSFLPLKQIRRGRSPRSPTGVCRCASTPYALGTDPAPAISRTGDGVEGPSRPEGAAKGETPCAALLGRFPCPHRSREGLARGYTASRRSIALLRDRSGPARAQQPRGFLHFCSPSKAGVPFLSSPFARFATWLAWGPSEDLADVEHGSRQPRRAERPPPPPR